MEKAPSTRQLKVAREIQKDMAEILRSKGMAAFGGAMVSVSEVRVSPDLSLAKIYVSIFPSDKSAAVMGLLDDNIRMYRGELGRLVGKQLRIVPELAFFLDTSIDYAEHIDICYDADRNLVIGAAAGRRYVAEIDIPPRRYEEVEIEGETQLVPVPLDIDTCTLSLWAIETEEVEDE